MIFRSLKKIIISISVLLCWNYFSENTSDPEQYEIIIDSGLNSQLSDLKNCPNEASLYRKLRAQGWRQQNDTPVLKKVNERIIKLATMLNVEQHWAKAEARIEALVAKINRKLPYSSVEIILLTIGTLCASRKMLSVIGGILKVGILASIFRCSIHLPWVKQYIENEKQVNGKMFQEKYRKVRKDTIKVLPAVGMSEKAIETRMRVAE
jgi:hypothetical protein